MNDARELARQCRADCVVFDFSFIRRLRTRTTSDVAVLERFGNRSLAGLGPGRIRYALKTAPNGCLISDLTLWRRPDGGVDVMTGRPEDVDDLAALPGIETSDPGTRIGCLSVQGPGTLAALAPLAPIEAIRALPYFGSVVVDVAGIDCLVGRLGYTGEAGVEIICDPEARPALQAALADRAPVAGFPVIDILRIEAGFVLFWNDFMVPVTAAEAGLSRFATPRPPSTDDALERICLRATARGALDAWRPPQTPRRPARPGEVAITSACDSPLACGPLLLGYARQRDLEAGIPLHDPTGAFDDIHRTDLPFFDSAKRRPIESWAHGMSQ